MVRNKQYILNNADTNERLLDDAKQTGFYAGQRVYMSMLFGKLKSQNQFCPGCHADGELKNEETIWCVCKKNYIV
jgi:hypothetical protein